MSKTSLPPDPVFTCEEILFLARVYANALRYLMRGPAVEHIRPVHRDRYDYLCHYHRPEERHELGIAEFPGLIPYLKELAANHDLWYAPEAGRVFSPALASLYGEIRRRFTLVETLIETHWQQGPPLQGFHGQGDGKHYVQIAAEYGYPEHDACVKAAEEIYEMIGTHLEKFQYAIDALRRAQSREREAVAMHEEPATVCETPSVLADEERAAYKAERAQLRKTATREVSQMIGESDAVLRAWHDICVAADADERVLISGETGTGKLLAAQMIHYASKRRTRPFERLDCGAISPALAESELFGHVKGAFTGAVSDRKGRFELAHKGTLCLDEVQNLPMECQAKLLAVLDEGSFRRVGDTTDRSVDVRIVAITNTALQEAIKQRTFRRDLYGRLNVLNVTMPPLRERQDDIRLLATKFGKGLLEEQEIIDLAASDYPENVRGLRNAITRIIAGRRVMDSGTDPASTGKGRPKIELNKEQIEDALRDKRTVRDAALALGVSEDTLRRRMRDMGISSPS